MVTCGKNAARRKAYARKLKRWEGITDVRITTTHDE